MAITLNADNNIENIPVTVSDGSPYYVGARAYVEQTETGAVITIIDKEGRTTATVLNGTDGRSIVSITMNADYSLTIFLSDGTSVTTDSIRGEKGNGIVSIEKTGTVDLVDTYTITLDDGDTETFDVTNGEKGDTGDTGNGIENIVVNDDYTLTVYYTDGEEYTSGSIQGERGFGILKVNTRPTTVVNSPIPNTYSRLLVSRIKEDAGVDEVFVGDTVLAYPPSLSSLDADTLCIYHILGIQEVSSRLYAYLSSHESIKGNTGATGADGFSPIVTVTEISGGHEVSIEDAEQTQTFDVMDGVTPVIPWDSILPIDTASGDIASFPDGSELVPARSVKVELEPIQDLHGYDKPWSGGNGVNKWDEATVEFGKWYDASGNLVSDAPYGCVSQAIRISGTSCCVKRFGATPNTYSILEYASDDTFITRQHEGDAADGVFTLNASTAYIKLQVSGYPAIRLTAETLATFKIVLAEGSTYPTTYSPYSNICPIYGRTECVTERTGVNVWDEEWELGNIDTSTGQKTSATDRIRSKNYISVLSSTTYYFNIQASSGVFLNRVFYYDADKGYISYTETLITAGGFTFTTPSNCRYLLSRLTSAYGTTYNHDISINYPSTDTSYHAYDGETYTTALGRTVYGGDVEQVGGSLTDKMGFVTIDGSDRTFFTEVSQATTADGTLYVAYIHNGVGIKFGGKALANSYEWKDAELTSLHKGQFNTRGAYTRFVIADQTINTLTKWREWLTANPLQLCYELATPQTYQLTGQEVDLLKGQNNVWSDGAVTVEYNADIQLYIEKKLG